jgi:hypothetical protein
MMFKSRRMKWAGHVACSIREKGNVYRIFVGMLEENRPV